MRLLICFVLVFPFLGNTQNLLVNSGFEEENICSEYKVNCAPEGWIYTVPSFIYYFKDARLAHNGQRFVSIIAGHSQKPYYRTFVRTRLLCALQKGKTYRLEFFVKSVHTVLDSIGVYFTSYDFLFEKQVYQKIVPSLYFSNAATKLVKGDTSWQKISLNYKATGEEVFLTLGNFSKGGISGPTGVPMERNFFVLFDDVSLTPTDVKEILCTDWKKTRDEIYTQDERHEFLDKYMKVYRSKPPLVPKATSTITLRIDTLTIPDVFFATNSFMLNTKAVSLLDSFSSIINKYKLDSINVLGHTDSRGTESINKELSWRRANSVASYLEKKLAGKINSAGMGSDFPIADNRTPEGRRRNRRVEIYLYIKE
jgi:outer membrane protein OmpA-like peptidoglycan-associated protein